MENETEVDSLVLDISVNDKSDGETSSKKIQTLTRVLTKFQKTILSLDTKVFRSKFQSMATSLKPFINQLNNAKSTVLALDRVLQKTSVANVKDAVSGKADVKEVATNVADTQSGTLPTAQDGSAQQLDNTAKVKKEEQTLKSLTRTYGEVVKRVTDADGVQTIFFNKMKGHERVVTRWTGAFDENGKVIEKESQKLGETITKVQTPFEEFFSSIKRIALYRAIRFTLKLITQAAKDGIRNLASFDAKSNQTMSEITSSMTVLRNATGTMIMPILQIVSPVLQAISKGIGAISNGISYLTAKIKGQNSYLKVNLDYMKEYNKQSRLLNFDEFSTLSSSGEDTGMFTQENIDASSGLLADLNSISSLIIGIGAGLAAWGGISIVQWIMAGGITRLWKTMNTGMATFYAKISPTALIIGGIALAVQSIFDIVNWDETTTGLQKVLNIVTLIAGVIAVACGVLAAFLPTGAAKIAKAIAFGAVLVGTVTGVTSMVTNHADGGMFEGTGTIYQRAGESGAEIVAKGTRGTGVVNIEQFKTAMIGALSAYNAARQGGDDRDIIIELDGKEIARQQVRNNASALSQTYNITLKPR